MSPGPQSLLVGTHSPYSTTSSHSSHITVQGFTSANVSGHFRPPFLAGTFTARVNTCQPLRSPKFSVGDCTSAAQLALHSPCASHPDTRQCCGHSWTQYCLILLGKSKPQPNHQPNQRRCGAAHNGSWLGGGMPFNAVPAHHARAQPAHTACHRSIDYTN